MPLIILGINLAGFIWGAAKMSAAIESLEATQVNINVEHKDYELRLRVIESEIAVLRTRIAFHEKGVVQ